jgi:circadian clock protein KaiC
MKADRNALQATTGVPGLDEVLVGGFPSNRIYLIQGDPGSGKTTLGLQFLLEGVRLGESAMYVSLSETREEILGVAASHGWSLDGIQLFEMSAADRKLSLDDDNTLFEPSEVELREIMQQLLTAIETVKPVRLVFDSLSELRLLSQNPLRYRRQILVLKQFLAGRQSTVLFLDDRTSPEDDRQLQSLSHGVLLLEQRRAEFGGDRRYLRVIKVRGLKPRGGEHELAIVRGGLRVFPRLVAAEHHEDFEAGLVSSGVEPLDELLGGGIDRGTATLIIGPAGSGKSSLAVRYALSAAERGENVAMFAFDERIQTLRARTRGLGLNLEGVVRSGRLSIVQIDPAEMGPGEFVANVGRAVNEAKARVIIIDSLNGYLNAMPEERALALQLHELLSMLGHRGVTSFMVLAQHGILGAGMQSPVDVSYLADTVIMLRYFEAAGMVRKAVSVLKKRSGPHEHTIREYGMGPPHGITVGRPLVEFRGILTGVPNYVGASDTLMGKDSGRSASGDRGAAT